MFLWSPRASCLFLSIFFFPIMSKQRSRQSEMEAPTAVFSKSIWNKPWSTVSQHPRQTDSGQLLSELNTILKRQEAPAKRKKVEITPLLLNHRWQISQKGPRRKQKSMRRKSSKMTPACSPSPLQKSSTQMAFYWCSIWMWLFPLHFDVLPQNPAIIAPSPNFSRFWAFSYGFSLTLYSVFVYLRCFYSPKTWKASKT